MVNFYSDPTLQRKHDSVFQSCSPSRNPLPPGIHGPEFQSIITQFRDIVGKENVIIGSDLINFRDPYPLDEDAHHASAAVW